MDPYLGEIRMFSGLQAPLDWHFCDGSLLQVADYQALFSLFGVTYGGDGVNNFALPDLRGRLPIGSGQGSNLTFRTLGQAGGSETVTLKSAETPLHSHKVFATAAPAAANVPTGAVWANSGTVKPYSPVAPTTPASAVMDEMACSSAGGDQPHNNMMPSLAINFIICVRNGIYPSPD